MTNETAVAKDGFRLVGKHAADCWGAEAGGFCCAEGVEWHDRLGRGKSGYSQWLVLRCNCTSCEARALVRVDVIAEMANEALPTRPKAATEVSSAGAGS